MKRFKIVIAFLLFLIPAASVFYKVRVENISFIPASSSDEWNVEVSYDLDKIFGTIEEDAINLPLIKDWYNQKVVSRRVYPLQGLERVESSKGKELRAYRGNKTEVKVTARLKLEESLYGKTMRSPLEKGERKIVEKQFLELGNVSERSLARLKELNQKFIFRDDTVQEKIRKIYFFVTEEIITSEDVDELKDVLKLAEGSQYAKARLTTLLARLNGIPARINIAYKVEQKKSGELELQKTFLPEVVNGDYWYPVSVNASTFNRVPERHFIVGNISGSDFKTIEKFLKVRAAPIMLNKVDSLEYRRKLAATNSFLSRISFHNFPISLHSVFYTVLLIPVGTLLLSFGRNVAGLKTFGIFTPILLSLFFLETSALTGAIFFLFIVTLGFAQRYILDRFHLLAVPRLSILLTLVVISFCVLGLFSAQERSFLQGGALNYFPIVIIAVFIERFSVHFIEEGVINTVKALFGTLTISLLCYLVLDNDFLKMALFNHPELLLAVVGGNLLIGSYKGYRFSELIRFKEFRRIASDV